MKSPVRRGGDVQLPASARSGLAGAVYAGARRFVPSEPRLPVSGPTGEMRQRLLLAALQLLAEALGIKPASLYNHMTSKEQLLAELVMLGHQTHADSLRAHLAAADPDPRAQLEAFVRGHVEVHAHWSMLSVVANTELHALPVELAEPSMQVRQASTELLVSTLERGQQSGAFDLPDVMLAAAAIGAIGMRVATWFDGDGTHTVAEVCDTYVVFVNRMVGAKPAGRSGRARASR